MEERILKLLALTESDSDGEALNAIQMANKILRKANLSWREFFNAKDRKEGTDRTGPKEGRSNSLTTSEMESLRRCLKLLLEEMDEDDYAFPFLKSVQSFARRNRATRKQYEKVMDIFESHFYEDFE